MSPRRPLLFLAALLLAGCAGPAGDPSTTPETRATSTRPAPTAAPVAPATQPDADRSTAVRVIATGQVEAGSGPGCLLLVEAAATNGDEGGVAWHDRMGDLRELFAAAVDRVDRHGRLAEGWTVPAATDWVWARAQPATFHHLVVDRGWPAADYSGRSVRSTLAEVVGPPA